MKRILSVALAALICICSSTLHGYAATAYNASILASCKTVACYSCDSGAFAYGTANNTVYSVKMLAEYQSRYLAVDGKIKSLCQNGKYTCALYTRNANTTSYKYAVVQMNTDSGKCDYYYFDSLSNIADESFSVSDGKIYFIKTDSNYAYVSAYNTDGSHYCSYKFSQNAVEIFNNNSNTYVILDDGSIYRISGTSSSFCTKTKSGSTVCSAGAGWISTDCNSLISLDGKSNIYVSQSQADKITVSNGNIKYCSGSTIKLAKVGSNANEYYSTGSDIKLIASYKDKTAYLGSDYNYTAVSESEFKSYSSDLGTSSSGSESSQADNAESSAVIYNITVDGSNIYKTTADGIMYGIESGTTVSVFKNSFDESVTVKSGGDTVTSGKIKTGQTVELDGKAYTISVIGDVTGEGNVKQNDETKMINYLLNLTDLDGAFMVSADYNLDGAVDNKDLVLISRKARG